MRVLIAGFIFAFLTVSQGQAAPLKCIKSKSYLVLPSKRLEVLSVTIKNLEKKLKLYKAQNEKRKSTTYSKLIKDTQKKITQYKSFSATCKNPRSSINTPTPTAISTPIFTPTSAPEQTIPPTAIPALISPVSQNLNGAGVAPVAFTLSATVGGASAQGECLIVSTSSDAEWNISGCSGTVTPNSHRVTSSMLQFKFKAADGRVSDNIGSVSVSFNQSGEFIGDTETLGVYKSSLSRLEAMRVIKNLAWGFSDSKREELLTLAQGPNGLENLVNELLGIGGDAPSCPQIESEAMQRAVHRMDAIKRRYTISFNGNQKIVTNLDPDQVRNSHEGWSRPVGNFWSAWNSRAAYSYWFYHMRYNCYPFRDVLALWFHNNIAVNLDRYAEWSGMDHEIKNHIDFLRSNVPETQGKRVMNFQEYIKNLIKDHASGFSLDLQANTYTNGGNENFARELAELGTMGTMDPVTGELNYDEDGVYQLRRALMGYRSRTEYPTMQVNVLDRLINQNTAIENRGHPSPLRATLPLINLTYERYYNSFNPSSYHPNPDRPDKIFLFSNKPYGAYDFFKADTINPNGDSLTKYLLGLEMKDRQSVQLRQTARFIAARLIATFGSSHMTNTFVDPISQKLLDTGYDLREAIKMIVTSSSFFAPEASDDCINDPTQTLIYFTRSLDLPMPYSTGQEGTLNTWTILRDFIGNSYDRSAGHTVTRAPSVFGWQSCGKIVGGRQTDGSTWLGVQAITERRNLIGDLVTTIKDQNGIDWFLTLLPAAANDKRNPEAVLNHFLNRLGITITDSQRVELLRYLNNVALSNTIANSSSQRRVPGNIQPLSWSNLSDSDFTSLMRHKIPTLLRLIYMLPQVHSI